jgi:ribulose-phosphate 3-epimerase
LEKNTSGNIIISASLLSADSAQLGKEARALEMAGADWLHIDVMDGNFVPQLTWGACVMKALKSWTRLPFDVHLMVKNPRVDDYIDAGAHTITFHPQAVSDPEGLLQKIKKKCRVGLAISPGHDYTQWPYAWWSLCDMITIMAVDPGAPGQSFLMNTGNVLKDIKCHYPEVLISIDGGINPFTISHVAQANVIVSGSFIFSSPFYQDSINLLKNCFLSCKNIDF